MNVDRWNHAIQIGENINDAEFSMENWKCGSVLCMLGHCASDPEFNEQDLHLVKEDFDWDFYPEYNKYIAYEAAAKFFDISFTDANYVFNPFIYDVPIKDVTKEMVLERMRKLLLKYTPHLS